MHIETIRQLVGHLLQLGLAEVWSMQAAMLPSIGKE